MKGRGQNLAVYVALTLFFFNLDVFFSEYGSLLLKNILNRRAGGRWKKFGDLVFFEIDFKRNNGIIFQKLSQIAYLFEIFL